MLVDTIHLFVSQTRMTHPQPYIEASSVIRVNGEVLFKGARPCVDTLVLLAMGMTSGEVALLTCSCGVAECAGFFERVQVSVDDECIHWTIPHEDAYAKAMHERWGPGPWHFSFDRVQMRNALRGHEQELLQLEKVLGSLALFPWEPFEEGHTPPPLNNLLHRARGLHLEGVLT